MNHEAIRSTASREQENVNSKEEIGKSDGDGHQKPSALGVASVASMAGETIQGAVALYPEQISPRPSARTETASGVLKQVAAKQITRAAKSVATAMKLSAQISGDLPARTKSYIQQSEKLIEAMNANSNAVSDNTSALDEVKKTFFDYAESRERLAFILSRLRSLGVPLIIIRLIEQLKDELGNDAGNWLAQVLESIRPDCRWESVWPQFANMATKRYCLWC